MGFKIRDIGQDLRTSHICVLAEDRKNWHRMPSDLEFTVLEAVAFVLKPLHAFTDALAGEKHITTSATFLGILWRKLVLITREMKETIADKLQAHYIQEETSDLRDKCSFLNPRFKAEYLANEERTLSQLTTEALIISEKLSIADDQGKGEDTDHSA